MKTLGGSLSLIIQLVKVQSLISRRFDGGLGGLSLMEFIILSHLSNAPDKRLRRIDLAGKVGLTASGVTRLLLPMEKIGYIKKEADTRDARVSFVVLASGGKTKFNEALARAESLAREIIPVQKEYQIKEVSQLISDICGTLY